MNRSQPAPVTDFSGLTGGSLVLGRRVSHHRPQWWRAGAWMLAMHAYLGLWFWVTIYFFAVAAGVLVSQRGQIPVSILQFAVHGTLWYPFSLMILAAAVQITGHVGNGMTRRSFAQASLLAVAAIGLGYGLAMAVGLEVEGALYDRAGWTHIHVANTGAEPDVRPEIWDQGFLVSLATYAVRTAGGAVAGLLVGTAYYRLGAVRGTLLLPLTVLPALAGQDDLAHVSAEALGLSVVAYDLLNLAVVVLAALAFWRLIRNIPIAQPRS